VDERAFVEALMAAVPEAFEGPRAREHYLEGEPLTHPALGDARIWLEDHAIKVSLLGRGARVRSGREDVVRRFWDFVEQQARAGAGDVQLETLLHLECFDGVVWVRYLDEYLGPRTRELFTGVRAVP
jgi:hypothetical protein